MTWNKSCKRISSSLNSNVNNIKTMTIYNNKTSSSEGKWNAYISVSSVMKFRANLIRTFVDIFIDIRVTDISITERNHIAICIMRCIGVPGTRYRVHTQALWRCLGASANEWCYPLWSYRAVCGRIHVANIENRGLSNLTWDCFL